MRGTDGLMAESNDRRPRRSARCPVRVPLVQDRRHVDSGWIPGLACRAQERSTAIKTRWPVVAAAAALFVFPKQGGVNGSGQHRQAGYSLT